MIEMAGWVGGSNRAGSEWVINKSSIINLLSRGDSSLPPVLLIHGLMDTAATFIPLMDNMSGHHYVTFDLPGHGRSDSLPGPPISPLHLVEAVRQIVEQLQWDTFHCIAHSMGYLIGAYYNAAFPGRIRKLVSLGGAITIQMHGIVESTRDYLEFGVKNYYSRYHARPSTFTHKGAVKAIAKGRDINEADAKILATRCLEPVADRFKFTWDLKAKTIFIPPISEDVLFPLLSVPTPTLHLVPVEDKLPIIFMEYHVKIMERLTNDSFVLMFNVPGGHSVHFSKPELIVPHIDRFFNEDCVISKL